MLILLILIFINGIFAMSEIAVVSARKARLQQRAIDGSTPIKEPSTSAMTQANTPVWMVSHSPWSSISK